MFELKSTFELCVGASERGTTGVSHPVGHEVSYPCLIGVPQWPFSFLMHEAGG